MATKIRLLAAFGALATAVILVMQSGPLTVQGPDRVELRSTAAPSRWRPRRSSGRWSKRSTRLRSTRAATFRWT
jgi:hypothetical protein